MNRFLSVSISPLLVSPLLVLLVVLPISLFAAPESGLERASPASVGLSEERLSQIEEVMKRYIDDDLVPGTVTLVARKGKVVHLEAQGYRDVERKQPMTTDTIFRIASMTKPITSVALMMLYEEGHFQLNDPISEFLPEFSDMQVLIESDDYDFGVPYRLEAAKREITFKHVLTHTAGFMNQYRDGHLALFQNRKRISAGDDLAAYIKLLAELPLGFHPGENWEYGPSTNVAGRLVEVISGMTLETFFRERIFEPLEMDDTYFYLPEAKLVRFAAQYRPGKDGKIELADAPTTESRFVAEPHAFFSGGGGLVSTAADYVRFQQMMLNGGELEGVRLLGRKTVESMFTNHTGDLPLWLRGPGIGFGLGYYVIEDIGVAGTTLSKGTVGWGGAFCTVFFVDPAEQLIGIMMTQVRPYTHIDIRQDFQSVTASAIVD